MPIKRDSIFNELIEACDSYAVVPNVTNPDNYYGRVRDISRSAVEAEPNDQVGLNKLISEIQILRGHLSADQLKASIPVTKKHSEKKSVANRLALRFPFLGKPAGRTLRLKFIPEEFAFAGFARFQGKRLAV